MKKLYWLKALVSKTYNSYQSHDSALKNLLQQI